MLGCRRVTARNSFVTTANQATEGHAVVTKEMDPAARKLHHLPHICVWVKWVNCLNQMIEEAAQIAQRAQAATVQKHLSQVREYAVSHGLPQ